MFQIAAMEQQYIYAQFPANASLIFFIVIIIILFPLRYSSFVFFYLLLFIILCNTLKTCIISYIAQFCCLFLYKQNMLLFVIKVRKII